MEEYKAETRLILRRFLRNQIDFPTCIAAFDDALTGLAPKLADDHMEALRAHVLSNNEVVMLEMAKRAALTDDAAS